MTNLEIYALVNAKKGGGDVTTSTETTASLPLTLTGNGKLIKNYRIYGNTVNGENVGDLITEGEHAGEYRVPVTVEGKNLFDNSKTANILNCYLSVSTLVSSVNTRTIFIECKPSTTYTVSKIRGNRFAVGWSDKLPAPRVELQEKVINYNASSITITTGLDAKYLVAYIYSAELDAPITADEMIASVQIEKGSTATPYEPYHAPVTTPIYLPEQIKMVGDEAEYVDYKEQKRYNADGTSESVMLPAIRTVSGTNVLLFGTVVQPSKMTLPVETTFQFNEESENVNATLQTAQINRLQSLDNLQFENIGDLSQEDNIVENAETTNNIERNDGNVTG